MATSKTPFEPHLVINEMTLPKSGEWLPGSKKWYFLQAKSGLGYWRQLGVVRELCSGAVLALAGHSAGILRASQLSELVVDYFCLDPEKLIGFLSLSELQSLRQAASREDVSAQILVPEHPISQRFKALRHDSQGSRFSIRLQLLQLAFDSLGCEIGEASLEAANEPEMNGSERLRQSLREMPASEFVGISLSELSPRVNCSTRHLSRLFRKELGVSFREKQTAVRLARVQQLLLSSDAKLVDVALTSGYNSYGNFAQLFKRHFGTSPAKWRQQNGKRDGRQQNLARLTPV